MSDNTSIEWTGEVWFVEEKVCEPLRWKRPRRVFVNSMSDLFHEKVPDEWIDRIFAVMALCPQHVFQVLTKRPQRMQKYIQSDRMGYIEGIAKRLLRERSPNPLTPVMVGKTLVGTWPWCNVWLGVSVEDQATAHERIPILLQTPAALRFASYEPALGSVDFTCLCTGPDRGDGWTYRWWDALEGDNWCDCQDCIRPCDSGPLDWLIVGGESGRKARSCNVAWLLSAVAQCRAAGVPCFVKQLGSRPIPSWIGEAAAVCGGQNRRDSEGADPLEWPEDLRVREYPRVEARA